MNKARVLIVALIAALVAGFFIFDLNTYLSLSELQRHQSWLTAIREEHLLMSLVVAFSIYVVVTALSLPGAAIMTLALGAIFGFGWGLVIASFASAIGATLAFLIARFLLHDWVTERFGKRLRTIQENFAKDGAFYLLTLRLVPAFPFFLINLLMGLTHIRVWTYYWVSQVGMLGGTAVYVNAGTQLAAIESTADIFSWQLFASFTLLGIFPLLAKWLTSVLARRKALRGYHKPKQFDNNLIVIGAGSAGLVSAYIGAMVKARVTLVESNKMGGDCLNTGCVPSKALLQAARRMQERRESGMGLAGHEPELDFPALMQHVREVIQTIEPHDSVERYTGLGVNVVTGRACLTSPWEVTVTREDGTTERLTSRKIIVATGASPWVPDLPGLHDVPVLTSDTLWDLPQLPGRLLVLGGGPIGSELAQAFHRLGSRVTLAEMGDQLLSKEDPEVAAAVAQQFVHEGIDVRLQHKAVQFSPQDTGGKVVLEYQGDDPAVSANSEVAFDYVLVALGRTANMTGFGLEELGIEPAATLPSNAFLQTRIPTIYAAGDVTGPYQFTHTAAHQAWYASVNALFGSLKRFKVDYRVIPWATFTDPEVATVGLNEKAAREQEVEYEVTRYDLNDLDRAIADGHAYGFIKVLTPPGKDQILGVTITGPKAGDLIAEFVLAMKHGLGLNKLLGTIHIYPTMNEANKYVAGAWKQNHKPERVLRWVERFQRWQRRG